jgi:GT2 family glycosyltransferase
METIICIPTYFANTMLQNCTSSIIDNVSNPYVTVYKNDVGWLDASNILMARNFKYSNIVLLNDDTLILSDIVKAFETVAATDPKIGIIGGVALHPNVNTVLNYGIYVGADGNTAHRYYGQSIDDLKPIEKQRAVEGSCMWINKELIREIGFFDPQYGMGYREEVDYAFRAREAGWKIVSTSAAKYVHFVSQTNGRLGITNDKYDYFMSKWGTKLKLGQI